MWLWAPLCGAVVGLSLGLTGGGGAILAVPLLVYVLGVPPRDAVTVSLVVVGVTALAGFLSRWRQELVELRVGALFAATGVLGAPVGAWIAHWLPEVWLLTALAALMLAVAIQLWRRADRSPSAAARRESANESGCPRDASGRFILSQRCVRRLLLLGAATGILTGLFGVGGGFVIVPALVLFTGMELPRAVGTSMFVVTLVSASGLAAQWWAGRHAPWDVAAYFLLGSLTGLLAGQAFAHRLSGPALQKTFAATIVAVAIFVIWKNF